MLKAFLISTGVVALAEIGDETQIAKEFDMTKILGIIALLSLTSGCITVYEGKYDPSQGWLMGTVLETGPNTASFEFSSVDCRRAMPQTEVMGTRFAYIQYAYGPTFGKYISKATNPRHAVVPIRAGIDVKEGDDVYVNVRDCAIPLGQPATATSP